MKRLLRRFLGTSWRRSALLTIGVSLLLAAPAFAQPGNSPWENAVNVLQQAFTSTIARGLALVAIVVAGLTFAFAPLRPTLRTRSTWSFRSNADPDADTFQKSSK